MQLAEALVKNAAFPALLYMSYQRLESTIVDVFIVTAATT